MRSGRYSVIDRDTARTPEERVDLMRKALLADTFLSSSNAISEDGQLVNIDGNGNRVACLIAGPSHVIVVAGMNKLTGSVEEAISRIRHTAAPPNCVRLNLKTPCASSGLCGDCQSPDSICCQVVVTRRSRHPGRITVILVGGRNRF